VQKNSLLLESKVDKIVDCITITVGCVKTVRLFVFELIGHLDSFDIDQRC